MQSHAVAGRRVLITRPEERAAGLARLVEAAGAVAVRFPTLRIEPVTLAAVPDPLDYDMILFVSPAAATHGAEALGLAGRAAPPLGAVGGATRRALAEAGLRVDIAAAGSSDSAGLLAADALAADRIAGRRMLIVRGQGGREALAEGLMARGAAVDYAEVYRRVRPEACEPDRAAACDIVTATSNEGLANLLSMLNASARASLYTKPLAVMSARTARLAREQGFERIPEVAPEHSDQGMMEAIRRCAASLPPRTSETA